LSDPEPFYMPDPALFGNPDAYRLYTSYATELEEAGLADLFPLEAEHRYIVIELLAERYTLEQVEQEPGLIDQAVAEARPILEKRQRSQEER
jgi:hypothetical protein